jgi:hypothetical protein
MFPIVHPYGHVVFQAGRGDVHTVLVNGKVVKHNHELVGIDLAKARSAVAATVEFARGEIGEQQWHECMNPEIPAADVISNPYTYTDYQGEGVAVRSDS